MALICAAKIDEGVAPGTRAGYQTTVVALLLAEVIRRKRDRDFGEMIRDEVFLPLGMIVSLGMPPETLELYRKRLGQTSTRVAQSRKPDPGRPTHHSSSLISCRVAMAGDRAGARTSS